MTFLPADPIWKPRTLTRIPTCPHLTWVWHFCRPLSWLGQRSSRSWSSRRRVVLVGRPGRAPLPRRPQLLAPPGWELTRPWSSTGMYERLCRLKMTEEKGGKGCKARKQSPTRAPAWSDKVQDRPQQARHLPVPIFRFPPCRSAPWADSIGTWDWWFGRRWQCGGRLGRHWSGVGVGRTSCRSHPIDLQRMPCHPGLELRLELAVGWRG